MGRTHLPSPLRSFETAGFLRLNGRGDGTPVPQGERPTTLAGHPEEARFFRAVSKDQGERSRKRIYEMLDLGRVSKTKELRKGACGGLYCELNTVHRLHVSLEDEVFRFDDVIGGQIEDRYAERADVLFVPR